MRKKVHDIDDDPEWSGERISRRGITPKRIAMLVWLEQFLIRYPELALFLVIAAGYWIGSFKIGAFSLGPVTGALFAGDSLHRCPFPA